METPVCRPVGKQVKGKQYFHVAALEELDPNLRERIQLAATHAGLSADADFNVVKIDEAGQQISLLYYEHFFDDPFPALQRSCVADLTSGRTKHLRYDLSDNPPILHRKELLLPPDHSQAPIFAALTQQLEAQHLFDFREGHGPTPQVFEDRLKAARLEVEGFALRPTRTLPSLDEKCGKHFTFREFITAGEIQTRTGIPNIPEQAETYHALVQLATLVLDPVIDYFGDIILTYGFCSRELAKHIPGRIAPALDQHASHELNSRGKPIYPRLGAAVDFLVTDENMLEVAQWIVQHTPFDRLYFYGADRPLHVSCGPENKREVVIMKSQKRAGRAVPAVMKPAAFLLLLLHFPT